jgi:hypothetical protein
MISITSCASFLDRLGEDLVPPAFGGAERFEQFLLTDEIVFLVVARHAGIADRRHALVAEAPCRDAPPALRQSGINSPDSQSAASGPRRPELLPLPLSLLAA